MAELIFSIGAFKPYGTPIPQVPILVDNEMKLVEPVCKWFLHIALVRGRTRSTETWRTYGEAIYDWWQTLEANDWDWKQITIFQVAAYRDGMLTSKNSFGRPYARSTINNRLRTISRFYTWCVQQKILEQIPFSNSEIAASRNRPNSFLAHVDAKGGRQIVNELTTRTYQQLPKPLSPDQIALITSLMSVRDRLIAEWSLTTGLRRMEIAALQISQLPSNRDDQLPALDITVTKGAKRRTIYPPRLLLDRTWDYIREERSANIRRTRMKQPTYIEPGNVFITRNAKPLTPRRVGAAFKYSAKKADSAATFHSLRHTFAVSMLRFLQRQAISNPELNPLLTLQVLMGHSDFSTTAIYLRVLATDLTIIEQSIDDLYESLPR
jgi:site-specific recombinase XerD